jgi:hypothetical protein
MTGVIALTSLSPTWLVCAVIANSYPSTLHAPLAVVFYTIVGFLGLTVLFGLGLSLELLASREAKQPRIALRRFGRWIAWPMSLLIFVLVSQSGVPIGRRIRHDAAAIAPLLPPPNGSVALPRPVMLAGVPISSVVRNGSWTAYHAYPSRDEASGFLEGPPGQDPPMAKFKFDGHDIQLRSLGGGWWYYTGWN